MHAQGGLRMEGARTDIRHSEAWLLKCSSRMKKGARANMTRTPIKTRCSVALHCGPRLKQDETLGERHSHTRLYAASSNCELYSSA